MDVITSIIVKCDVIYPYRQDIRFPYAESLLLGLVAALVDVGCVWCDN